MNEDLCETCVAKHNCAHRLHVPVDADGVMECHSYRKSVAVEADQNVNPDWKCQNCGRLINHDPMGTAAICEICAVGGSKVMESQDSMPNDELVERVAALLFRRQCPHLDWDRLDEFGDAGMARGSWYSQARSHLAEIEKPLSDGSRVVRTDPDQSLPKFDCGVDWAKYKDVYNQALEDMAGWVKVLPLIERPEGSE